MTFLSVLLFAYITYLTFRLALVSIYEIEVTLFYQQILSTNAEY